MRVETETFHKQRFLALDFLRGIAALIVAFGHAYWLSRPLDGGRSIDFTMAVAFFFILSGYVLTHAYEKAVASGVMTARDFVVVRIARLYPLHVLTAIVMAFGLLLHSDIAKTTFTQIMENVTLTQTFFSGDASLNQPSWSISIEFWCGLILLPLWSRSRLAQAAALVLATAAFVYADFRGGFIYSYFNRACISLACFAIGWMLRSVSARPHAMVGWLLSTAAFGSMMFPPVVATGRPGIEFCYLIVFTGAVFCLAPVKMPHRAQQVARFLWRNIVRDLPLAFSAAARNSCKHGVQIRNFSCHPSSPFVGKLPVFRAANDARAQNAIPSKRGYR